MFPAAAIAYRQGYIRQAEPVVREDRRVEDVLSRLPPSICEDSGFDPNRAENSQVSPTHSDRIDPLAFLVGPVRIRYSGGTARTDCEDLRRFIDRDKKFVRSATEEIMWDYGRGVCTVDALRVQGACGFLGTRGEVALADVTLRCENRYAAVFVVSLDGRPLAESGSVLVQVGTTARPTGWRTAPFSFTPNGAGRAVGGEQIKEIGTGPWRVENTRLEFALRNPILRKATLVDASGHAVRRLALDRRRDKLTLTLPPDAMYVVLR